SAIGINSGDSTPDTDLEAKFKSGVGLTDAEEKQLKKLWRERWEQERARAAQARADAEAQLVAEYRQICAEAGAFVAAKGEMLVIFRRRLTALFEAMRGDKEPFKRRPNISLRLIARGDPPAKVITLPGVRYDRTGGYLVPADHTIELMEQT